MNNQDEIDYLAIKAQKEKERREARDIAQELPGHILDRAYGHELDPVRLRLNKQP